MIGRKHFKKEIPVPLTPGDRMDKSTGSCVMFDRPPKSAPPVYGDSLNGEARDGSKFECLSPHSDFRHSLGNNFFFSRPNSPYEQYFSQSVSSSDCFDYVVKQIKNSEVVGHLDRVKSIGSDGNQSILKRKHSNTPSAVHPFGTPPRIGHKLVKVDTTEVETRENIVSKTSSVSPSSITKFTKPSTLAIKISDSVSLDTKNLTETILNELKEHQISQTVFAKKVLGRSQGTFSELIKHPRPWEQLLTVGRATYHKMNNWLVLPLKERLDMLGDDTTTFSTNSKNYSKYRKRFFFTLVQKRTLEAFFKSHPNPSHEMKVAIAKQLELDLSQVSNFFFNSRRRIHYSKLGKQMNQSVSDNISEASAKITLSRF